jgi:hypothetical protein
MFVTEVAVTQNGVERPGTTKQVGGGHGVRRQKCWRVRKLHRGFLAKSVVRMESSWVGGEKLGSRRRNKLLREEEKKKRRRRRKRDGRRLLMRMPSTPPRQPFPASCTPALDPQSSRTPALDPNSYPCIRIPLPALLPPVFPAQPTIAVTAGTAPSQKDSPFPSTGCTIKQRLQKILLTRES